MPTELSGPRPERWFYLDEFEAHEFSPVWRWLDRYYVQLYGLPNWCRVHYERGDDEPIIEVPIGSYHHFALDRVNEIIGELQ